MRAIRFIISFIGIFAIVFFTIAVKGPFAVAQVNESELKAVYPNLVDADINLACPKGSQKIFFAEIKVPRHTRIKAFDDLHMILMSGNELVSTGSQPADDHRHVYYYLYPPSRKAKVDLYDTRYITAYLAYTSHTYTFKLWSDCTEKFPAGME